MSRLPRLALLVLLLGAAAPPFAPAPAPAQAAPFFGDDAFRRVWDRTDSLVQDGSVARSWFWGPVQRSGPLYERLDGFPGNQHTVQYFDKSRMEVNPTADPASKWRVTNGLLTVELISGLMQIGLHSTETRQPSTIPLASDGDDANAPTYASFLHVSNTARENHPQPAAEGADVNAIIDRAGNVRSDPARNRADTRIARYVPETQHNIPGIFWDFLNQAGPVRLGGAQTTEALSDPWNFATGFPISEAYWAYVKITDADHVARMRWVLVQAYERRVLTFIPDYPAPWNIQMGNIGLHYVQWRYGGLDKLPGQAVVSDVSAGGSVICRANGARPCDPAPVDAAGYYGDTLQSGGAATVRARTAGSIFRLMPSASLKLQRNTSGAGGNLLTILGQIFFSHRAGDEIVINSGNVRVEPIDTVFSVRVNPDGSAKVSVIEGDGGVRITGPAGRVTLHQGSQMSVDERGAVSAPQPFDAETQRLWAVYGQGADLDLDAGRVQTDPAACKQDTQNEIFPGMPAKLAAALLCPVDSENGYDSGNPAPVYFYHNGTLLHDIDSSTLYAIYTVDNKPVWDSFAFPTADTPDFKTFLGKHKPLVGRLGPAGATCSAPTWSYQPFANGTLIQPPADSCDSLASVILALAQDGSWTQWPVLATPAPPGPALRLP
jgi:hypothetical protein